mmetsp:Transcript_98052/g.204520  ORF Transcript_98052/g.204520 Transcript_98052/m.204520 type:complete len:99 (-) Transcript_98052:80-376(-)|eukprot:CAMPEP_0206456416 /NCGR_PEP_ID=MMETSP0324_2-20121206/22358_1 /ASSEMBLY_ACC=CAM_ASM_000836 /TAXON_ID=2866 /ORGANISM="Crypthecodinium cohnii, Strain Seligo" /LENGTH=98 /DNA_ID=CAMNT_0053927353 /DNA_START=135 /DNA_END=431 /DNA_ORIENTATION=+
MAAISRTLILLFVVLCFASDVVPIEAIERKAKKATRKKAKKAEPLAKDHILMQVYSGVTPGSLKGKVTKTVPREPEPCQVEVGDEAGNCAVNDELSLR